MAQSKMSSLGELKTLGAKLDSELPSIRNSLSQPRRPGLSGDAAMAKIEKIHEEILGPAGTVNNELRDIKRLNSSTKNVIDFGSDRLSSIDKEINSIIERLKNYGFVPEKDKTNNTSLQAPEEISSAQKNDEKQHTPDLTNFGLSSNTVELIFSTQKSTVSQTRYKNILINTDNLDLPRFDLDDTLAQEDLCAGATANVKPLKALLDSRKDGLKVYPWNSPVSAQGSETKRVNNHDSNVLGDSSPDTPELTSVIALITEAGDSFESPPTPSPTFLHETNLDVTPTTPEFRFNLT